MALLLPNIPSKSHKFLQERKLNPIPHLMNEKSTIPQWKPTNTNPKFKAPTKVLTSSHPKTYFPNSTLVTLEIMPLKNHS
jgi:hypothetical protein